MTGRRVRLTADELDGDLPLVCARTGNAAEGFSTVWFTRSPGWAWLPLGLLLCWALISTDWGPLASWWAVGAVMVPVFTSRGVTGRVPLDRSTRIRLARLRTRRFTVLVSALLLTWVAVALRLVGSHAAAILVLVIVVALYILGVGMFIAARLLMVRGQPEPDGGATLRDVHQAFVDAVDLHRTGHRP